MEMFLVGGSEHRLFWERRNAMNLCSKQESGISIVSFGACVAEIVTAVPRSVWHFLASVTHGSA